VLKSLTDVLTVVRLPTTCRPIGKASFSLSPHVESDLRADLDRHHLTEVIGPAKIFDTLQKVLAAIHRLS
jgi:hypothetical protein